VVEDLSFGDWRTADGSTEDTAEKIPLVFETRFVILYRGHSGSYSSQTALG